ncbi:MAG: hypothetical protein N0E44_15530, partial [Candidatus Thiodiazotropha lotti]|nr:hypothetical protein [Candidatus Thiodiazotropha lotti]MCW4221296.1 hypothetical protein [Candidatus Thiodiazotropha lotti]
ILQLFLYLISLPFHTYSIVQVGVYLMGEGFDGLGTVLSRMAVTRNLECDSSTAFCPDGNSATFEKGYMVGCVECHENEINHD